MKKIIEWEPTFALGIPQIDEQHKRLLAIANALFSGCLSGDETARDHFLTSVKEIAAYIEYHIRVEECLLTRFKYPGIGQHIQEHQEFIKDFREGVKLLKEGEEFVPDQFVNYLKDWILTHIAVKDKKYARFIFGITKKVHIA
jgi:hemerythrin